MIDLPTDACASRAASRQSLPKQNDFRPGTHPAGRWPPACWQVSRSSGPVVTAEKSATCKAAARGAVPIGTECGGHWETREHHGHPGGRGRVAVLPPLSRPASAETDKPGDPISATALYLRWRIFERMRRFLRPSLRRPFPVFFTPTSGLRQDSWYWLFEEWISNRSGCRRLPAGPVGIQQCSSRDQGAARAC